MRKVLIGLLLLTALAAGCKKDAYRPTQAEPGKASTTLPALTSIRYSGKDGKNALDLLRAAYQVQTKSYSFGEMVESINGQRADSKHFWAFYVNGKQATTGASQYVTKNGEDIEWKWEELK